MKEWLFFFVHFVSLYGTFELSLVNVETLHQCYDDSIIMKFQLHHSGGLLPCHLAESQWALQGATGNNIIITSEETRILLYSGDYCHVRAPAFVQLVALLGNSWTYSVDWQLALHSCCCSLTLLAALLFWLSLSYSILYCHLLSPCVVLLLFVVLFVVEVWVKYTF